MRLSRWASIASVTSILAVSLVVAGGVSGSPALACSHAAGDHCYGQVAGATTSLTGVFETISLNCLGTPSDSFSSQEVWIANQAKDTWIEAGFLAHGAGGLNWGGLTTGGTWGIWAEEHADGNFYSHPMVHFPSLGSTAITILYNGSGSWDVWFGGYHGSTTSSAVTFDPIIGEYGAETDTNSGASYGTVTQSGYYDAGYNPHYGGIPLRTTEHDAPETFSWITAYSTFHAGIPC